MNVILVMFLLFLSHRSGLAAEESTPKSQTKPGKIYIKIGGENKKVEHGGSGTQSGPTDPERLKDVPPIEVSRPMGVSAALKPTDSCPDNMISYSHPRKFLLDVWEKSKTVEGVFPVFRKVSDFNNRYKVLSPKYFDQLDCTPNEDANLKAVYEILTTHYSKKVFSCTVKFCIPYGKKVVEQSHKSMRKTTAKETSVYYYPKEVRSTPEANLPWIYNATAQADSDFFEFFRVERKNNENVIGIISNEGSLLRPVKGEPHSVWTPIKLLLE